MSSSVPVEEQICPLCMELIEYDDLSFYPCQCGYQICRFCWHRIRTNENGLCPACRKLYNSCPDRFQPVTFEQHKEYLLQLNKNKNKCKNKKQIINKLSTSDIQATAATGTSGAGGTSTTVKRNLNELRVIQKNLIFVIGLSLKISNIDELKKYIYFGKYGKILKIVVSTNGVTGSAYITYEKPNEALKAIQKTNNIIFDHKLIKTSLGTTKYCSYYLKQLQCTKTECMYLHEKGDDEASFTKEDMLAGKHTEYEKRLLSEYIESTLCVNISEKNNEIHHEMVELAGAAAPSIIEELEEEEDEEEEEEEEEENNIETHEVKNDHHDHENNDEKFDPFNETNQIFEELIQIHSKDLNDKQIFLLDPPTTTRQQSLYYPFTLPQPPQTPPPPTPSQLLPQQHHHPPGFSNWIPSQQIHHPPGFNNWIPQQQQQIHQQQSTLSKLDGNEWIDPAIIFSQLYPTNTQLAGYQGRPQQQQHYGHHAIEESQFLSSYKLRKSS